MLSRVERRCLSDYSKDQSGSAMMEGTLASGGERDVATAKSGLVLERWWVDHRLRTVVIGGGGGAKMNLLEKDLEGQGNEGRYRLL